MSLSSHCVSDVSDVSEQRSGELMWNSVDIEIATRFGALLVLIPLSSTACTVQARG